jgi:serine/threonine protein kinase/tetratricopeptide (TPR) repeat protein
MLVLPDGEEPRRLLPRHLYLETAPAAALPDQPQLRCLYPLAVCDMDQAEVLFFNARRGDQRIEYLCYNTDRVLEHPEWAGPPQAFLAQVLKMPSKSAPPAAEPEPPPAPLPALPPRHIGEFELLSRLGKGGMGVVYRAWQASVGRQVALKCLLPSDDLRAEARFGREIRALGRVEHPHLVKIFTSGSDGDQWFYAMELIEGTTLAAVCENLQTQVESVTEVDLEKWRTTVGTACAKTREAEKFLAAAPSPPALPLRVPAENPSPAPLAGASYVTQVVELVRQAADAAHTLHEAGVVHRDIKPGNIMVGAEGTRAVLMDLGLAQLADEKDGRLTRTRQFVGTLRYASPEQVLAVGKLDRRSDVYSLGVTLWELLTLRPMYRATEAETPTPELMRRILTWSYGLKRFVRRQRQRLALVVGVIVLQVLLVAGLYGLLVHSRDKGDTRSADTDGAGPAIAVASPASEPERPVPTDPGGKRRALLIGCGNYPLLGPRFQLRGVGNDLVLMHKLLREKLLFAEEDIVTVADARATHERIVSEIRRLADLTAAGDRLVIYLSGHSTLDREPKETTNAATAAAEPESIYLPADVRSWNGESKAIPGAISSREFADWIKALVDRGGFVWLIYDCCHGGFGLSPELPSPAPSGQGGAAFLYAAGSREATFERSLPENSPDAKWHGLFTYSLNQVLTQAAVPIRYAELAQRIRAQIVASGLTSPRPWAAGGHRDHPILDDKAWAKPLPLLVSPSPQGGLILNAGSLHGLTPGMVLAGKPLAGKDQVLGYVRITAVQDFAARAESCPYAGVPVLPNLREPLRCELVRTNYGDLRLRLWVGNVTREKREAVPEDRRQHLTGQIQELVRQASLPVELTEESKGAHWEVQLGSLKAGDLFLTPHLENRVLLRGITILDERPDCPLIGPIPAEKAGNELPRALGRVARAQNLMAVTELLAGEWHRRGSGLDIGLQLVRFRDETDQSGQPIGGDGGQVRLRKDDLFAVRIENFNTRPVDVTLLHVDGKDYTLRAQFPAAGKRSEVRVAAGETLTTPRQRAQGDGTWEQHLLLIAVAVQGRPVDFSFLTQPTLETARKAADPATLNQTLDSPFGRFLQNALYAASDSRGLETEAIGRLGLRRLTWQTMGRDEGAYWLGRHLRHAEQGAWAEAAAEYVRAVTELQSFALSAEGWWPLRDRPHYVRESARIHWQEVLTDLDQVIATGKASWWAWRARGLARIARREWKQAAADFTRAAELQPTDWESWRAAARANVEAGQWDKAGLACSKAIELKPDDWGGWYLGAIASRQLGQYERVASDLSKALELGAQGWAVWAYRGLAYTVLGRWQEAEADCSKALQRERELYPELYLVRYLARAQLGRSDDAEADYAKAVAATAALDAPAVGWWELPWRTILSGSVSWEEIGLDLGRALGTEKDEAAARQAHGSAPQSWRCFACAAQTD